MIAINKKAISEKNYYLHYLNILNNLSCYVDKDFAAIHIIPSRGVFYGKFLAILHQKPLFNLQSCLLTYILYPIVHLPSYFVLLTSIFFFTDEPLSEIELAPPRYTSSRCFWPVLLPFTSLCPDRKVTLPLQNN